MDNARDRRRGVALIVFDYIARKETGKAARDLAIRDVGPEAERRTNRLPRSTDDRAGRKIHDPCTIIGPGGTGRHSGTCQRERDDCSTGANVPRHRTPTPSTE